MCRAMLFSKKQREPVNSSLESHLERLLIYYGTCFRFWIPFCWVLDLIRFSILEFQENFSSSMQVVRNENPREISGPSESNEMVGYLL